MATAYESAYHIGQARLRGGLPSTDARFSDAKLLKLLSDELQGNIAPLIHNAKSEHGIARYSATAVVGQSEYPLPPNAFAGTLRDVCWVDASSKITPLTQRSAADPLMYALSRNNGTPAHYYLRGSGVAIVPPPGAAGTIALPHYARPNRLVLIAAEPATEGAVRIATQAYNTVTQTLVLTTSVAPPTPLQPASTAVALDIVRSTPGFETIISAAEARVFAEELSPTSWRYTITAVTSNPLIVGGDYICLSGESPAPQCPVELFPLLHARAALVAVPSTGDMSQAAAALAAQVADLEAKAISFLTPRVESGSPPPGRGLGSNPLLGVVSGWGGY